MVDGDLDSAEAVTHTRIAETLSDGSTIVKNVLERLDSITTPSRAGRMEIDPLPPVDDFNYDATQDMPGSRPPTPVPKKRRVSVHII
jgi:hypothetical protein